MRRLHFIAFGSLEPVDNGYKSTACNLIRELGKIANVTLFRVPAAGRAERVPHDAFDGRAAALRIPVKRVNMDRRLGFGGLLRPTLAGLASALLGRRNDWLAALHDAGVGARNTPVICIAGGWDPFAVSALQFLPDATLFVADSITLFQRSRAGSGPRSATVHAASAAASKMERLILNSALRQVVYVSQRDAKFAADLGAKVPIAVVPIGVNPDIYTVPPPRPLVPPQLAFSGVMDYLPNKTAAATILKDVWPRLKTPEVTLLIVGSGAAKLKCNGDPRVTIRDWVPSIQEAQRGSALFLAPMQMGSGAQNKVIQALAAGIPVLGTPAAFSGFETLPTGAFCCPDIEAFPSEIDSLLAEDEKLWSAGQAGRNEVLARYTWNASARALATLAIPGVERGTWASGPA